MAESKKTDKASPPLGKWTMVGSQGDIVGDADSESSESSIEIVDVDSDQGLSSHSSSQEHKDGVVVTSVSPSAPLVNQDEAKITSPDHSCVGEENSENCQDLTKLEYDEHQVGSDYPLQERGGETSGNLATSEEDLQSTQPNAAGQEIAHHPQAEDNSVENNLSLHKPAQTQEDLLSPAPAQTCLDEPILCCGKVEELIAEHRETAREECSTMEDQTMNTPQGACCAELLEQQPNESSETQETSENLAISDSGIHSAPTGVEGRQSLDQTGVIAGGPDSRSRRSDSDSSDSDFIRLEPGLPRDLANVSYALGRESSEERVVIPLRLSTSSSSIRPNFNFMQEGGVPRNFEPRAAEHQEEEDEDGDDDTESCTEEGFDDRIESEQSEAGSEPPLDVGDLSSFGDIGDLPLVVGNVARNYIHQPNQHVTTTLNMIVVLAAFLTMGLSLGIMMATDLEIEEWQTAYDLQTKKVVDLEKQLMQQRVKFEHSTNLQQSVYVEVIEKTKKELQLVQNEYNGYLGSLELISTYELEDPHFISLMQSVKHVVKNLSKCNTIGQRGWMKAPFCYLQNQELIESLKAELLAYSLAHRPVALEEPIQVDAGVENEEKTSTSSNPKKAVIRPNVPVSEEQHTTSDSSEGSVNEVKVSVSEEGSTEESDSVNSDISNQTLSELEEVNLSGRNLGSQVESLPESYEQNNDLKMAQNDLEETVSYLEEVNLSGRNLGHQVESLPESHEQNIDLKMSQNDLEETVSYLASQKQKENVEHQAQDFHNPTSPAHSSEEQLVDQCPSHNENVITQTLKGSRGIPVSQSIELDIHQLQQSLSKEQQRALHWQQLYLAERRQREHERESEIWEDQRDRKRWEQEREREEHVECLHKLISSNITTLTQFLTGWNVSVYDDFANLSMLMSSVAELRKSVVSSVQKIGEGAETIYEKIKQEGEDRIGSINWGEAVNTKEEIIQYVQQLFHDVEREVDDVLKNTDDWEEKPLGDSEEKEVEEEYMDESDQGPHSYEDEKFTSKTNFRMKWTKGFHKLVYRTRKSIGKFGKKVTSIVHRMRDIWTKKKPMLASFAKDFSIKALRITEKFVKHLSKDLHVRLFTDAGRPEKGRKLVDIHSSKVKDLRKKWQRHVDKDPCKTLGVYSAECNMHPKERRGNMKAINKDFQGLMNFRVNFKNPKKTLKKFGEEKVKDIYKKLNAFMENWHGSKLLLQTDIMWAECQLKWWSEASKAVQSHRMQTIPRNTCDFIDLSTVLREDCNWQKTGGEFCQHKSDKFHRSGKDTRDEKNKNNKYRYSKYFQRNENVKINDNERKEKPLRADEMENDGIEELVQRVKVEPVELDPRHLGDVPSDGEECNHTMSDKENKNRESGPSPQSYKTWRQKRAMRRLHLRREKERIRLDLEQSSDIKEDIEEDNTQRSSDWLFRKAEDRQLQREKAQRWKEMDVDDDDDDVVNDDDDDDIFDDDDDDDDDEEEEEDLPNWFLEAARERERLRMKEHQSDWLFERASDRRQQHHLWKDQRKEWSQRRDHKENRHHKHQASHQGKQHFRHSYGRVVTP